MYVYSIMTTKIDHRRSLYNKPALYNKIDIIGRMGKRYHSVSVRTMISVSSMASNALYLFSLSAFSKYTTGLLLLNTFTLSTIYEKYYGKGVKKRKMKCFGGILRVKNTMGEYEYAVVQGRKTLKWSFPKGHADEGEEHLETALREIEEETGIKENLGEPVQYIKSASDHYYIFDLEKKLELNPIDTTEVVDTKWVTLRELEGMDVNVGISIYMKRLKRGSG